MERSYCRNPIGLRRGSVGSVSFVCSSMEMLQLERS